MSFENNYSSFLNAIIVNDYTKAENVIAQCDDRRTMLLSAVNDLGEQRIKSMIELFRGIGLKRALEKIIQTYNGFELVKNVDFDSSINKTIYVSEKNKLKNEKYHLTGSSFENQKKAKATA